MKTLSTVTLSVILLIASCTHDNDAISVKNPEAQLALASDHFQALGVSPSVLDLDNISTGKTPAGRSLLVIPYKNQDFNNSIINVLDENGQIVLSTVIQFEPTSKQEDLSSAFDNGEFSGKLSLVTSTGDYFGFDYKKSKTSRGFYADEVIKEPVNTRTQKCAYWTKQGGIFDCGGASLVNEGPLSKVLCYIDFIPCLGGKIIDCYLQDCPPQQSKPSLQDMLDPSTGGIKYNPYRPVIDFELYG